MDSSPGRQSRFTTDDSDDRIAALLRTVAHTGEMRTESIQLPATTTTMVVTSPSDADLLLDQASDDPEQNLPYWAEVWPSGLALGAAIEQHPNRVRRRRVLELGSGVGITAAVALRHDACLTATDYAEESLTLTRITTRRFTGREPDHVQRVNWRNDSVRDLVHDGAFDVVLAADVLYERRDIEPLLRASDLLLKDDGALWLAEPGRDPAKDFLTQIAERGWTDEVSAWTGPWPDRIDTNVTVHCHWLTRKHITRA